MDGKLMKFDDLFGNAPLKSTFVAQTNDDGYILRMASDPAEHERQALQLARFIEKERDGD